MNAAAETTPPLEAEALLAAAKSQTGLSDFGDETLQARFHQAVAFLKSIGSPIPQVKFCPTGGISLKIAPDYLALKNILCVGGSWVAPKEAMAKGDLVFIYHSGDDKAVVGIAKVTKAAYPDETAKEGDWVAVELSPVKALKKPLTLNDAKKVAALKEMVLLHNSRLSVQPVTAAEWKAIAK